MLRSAGSKLQNFQKESIKFHGLGLSLIVVTSLIFANPIITFIIGGILHTVLAVFIIISEKKNNQLHITPISILFLYVFFSDGLSAIYISTEFLEQDFIPFVNVFVYAKSIEMGYIINILGVFFLHLALQIFRPTKNIGIITYTTSLPRLLFLFLVGILFLVNPVLSLYLGSFLVASIVWLPTALILYIVLASKQSLRITLQQKKIVVIIFTIVVLAIQVFSLSKLNILLALLPAVWFFIIENEKKWKTVMVIILLMIFYSYFIYPFVTSARQNFLSTLTTNNPISELSGSHQVRSYILQGEYVEETRKLDPKHNAIEAFLFRMFDSVPSGFIFNEVEVRGYTLGKSLEYVLYGLVPRIIWPDKPIVSRGGWFTNYVGSDIASATAMTSFGELYWNFGFVGVALGMFIIGALYAGLWRLAGFYPQSSILSVWLYFLVMYGMMMHSEAGSVFIGVIQLYILFGLLILFRRSLYHKNIPNYQISPG